MSRVRENCMHGSRWQREETEDGRQACTALAPPTDPTTTVRGEHILQMS